MLHGELARAFQERARSGNVCLGIHSSAMSPQLVELYGILELDFVIIGAEVESLDIGRMEEMIRAADAARTVPIVKLRRPSPDLIGEVMNAGAPMVMVPHVTNRGMLENLVRAAQFEPAGLRGECPISRYNGYGALSLAASRETANSAHAIIPIIEDREALDHLDEMMSVEGVDIFEVGPWDLSKSLGEPGQGYNGPKTLAAIDRICDAAQRHGKAMLAPLWYKGDAISYRDIIQYQIDELLARGINCVYELETAFLAFHLRRLSLLKRVREEPAETEPADAGAATNGKASAKAANAKAASPKAASPKAASPKAASPKAANGKAASPKAPNAKIASPKAPNAKAPNGKAASPKAASAKAASAKAARAGR